MSDFKEVLFESKNLINVIKNSDIGELQSIAHEIRDFIVETVQQNGGHLSSNLGTVELTLALYRVFDFPEKDMLVWDTGHQTYTHKILTERMQSFKTLKIALFRVICNGCGVSGPAGDTRKSAIEAHNAMPRALRWTNEPPKVAGK